MATTVFKSVAFGSGKTGLSTVGYRLYNADFSTNGGRITAGVQESLAPGCYGATVSLPTAFYGFIVWDTGEGVPVYAMEEVNSEQYESVDTLLNRLTSTRATNLDNLDATISSRATAASVLSTLDGAHGVGPWDGDAAGAGAHVVTITVNAASGIAVSSVGVTLKDSAQTNVLRTDTTNSSGQVSFNLDTGTYKVILRSSPFYDTLPVQTLVVSGNTAVTYTLDNAVLAGSGEPNLCRVHFYSEQIGGVMEAGVSFQFKLTARRYIESSGVFVRVAEQVEQVTDYAGHGYVDLLISSSLSPGSTADSTTYRVTCPAYRLDATFTVPDTESANLADLI